MSVAASSRMSVLAEPVVQRRRTWNLPRLLLGLFLLLTFFTATQDLQAPIQWLDDGDADIAGWVDKVGEGRPARQVGFLVLAVFGALGLVLPSRHDRPARIDWLIMYPLLAIVAWASMSVLWSIQPAFTAKRLVVFTAMWTSIAAIVKHFDVRDLAFAVVVYGFGSLLVGVYAEVRAGAYLVSSYSGSPWRLAGAMHPNHLGLTMAMTVLGLAYYFTITTTPRRRSLIGLAMFVAVIVLYLTRSRTSLAALMFALGLFALLRMTPRQALASFFVVGLAALVGAFFYYAGVLGAVWEVLLLGRKESDVTTLTGRTDIWAFAIEFMKDDYARMIVGVGHDTFFTPENTDAISKTTSF
ncbi:MAG: O-antigen ligase family protein, partial [Planctomycetota bacterium]